MRKSTLSVRFRTLAGLSGRSYATGTFATFALERNLKITNKAGVDLITLTDGTIQGATRINNGNGGSAVTVREVDFANNVSITSRAAPDAVDMEFSSADRNLTINNGVDGGSIQLGYGGVPGSTRLTSGDGFDNLQTIAGNAWGELK